MPPKKQNYSDDECDGDQRSGYDFKHSHRRSQAGFAENGHAKQTEKNEAPPCLNEIATIASVPPFVLLTGPRLTRKSVGSIGQRRLFRARSFLHLLESTRSIGLGVARSPLEIFERFRPLFCSQKSLARYVVPGV